MRKSYSFLPLGAFLLFSISAAAQSNYALTLSNGNFVAAGSDVVNPNGAMTVEFWTYVPSTSIDGQIHQWMSEGSSGLAFYIGYDATGNILLGDFAGSSGIPVPTDRWVHIALTYDGIQNTNLYIDGTEKYFTQNFFFTDGNPLNIGAQIDNTQTITAKIDEIKSWYSERTAAQVKSDMFTDPGASDPLLETWYKMNDGSGINLLNSASTGGPSQNGTIMVDPGGANSWTASPVVSNLNGLVFDGVDDQVIIPVNAGYDIGAAGGTVEFWVNPTTGTLSGTMSTLLGNRGSAGIKYSYHLSSTSVGLETSAGMSTLNLTTLFPSGFPGNTWTHLAFVYDGTSTTQVYVNGTAMGTLSGTYDHFVTNQNLVLGIAKNVSTADDRPFAGGIDEVRIWNVQKTQADIINNMSVSLSGFENGLAGEFSFDDGTPGVDNTGLITALDNSTTANHGTLTNFALSGTTSNFTAHTAVTPISLPLVLTKFTAAKNGASSILQWTTAMEQNTSEFIIQRSADGVNYSTIGTVGAAGNSSTPKNYTFTDIAPANGNDYYRLQQVDLDAKFTYSPVCVLNFQASGNLFWYATGKSTVEVHFQQGSNEIYILSDISGRTLKVSQLSEGNTTLTRLTPGMYVVSVRTKTGSILTTQVLIP